MIFERKELRNLIISILVVGVAFTIRKISLFFLLQCLSIVTISYLLHHILHASISDFEGLHTKCRLWPVGIIVTILSGILSNGMAVLAIPSTLLIKEIESKKWMKEKVELSVREIGLASISGTVSNLVLGALFLIGFKTTGILFFHLGALINFWICFANLIPIPPIDGSRVMSWDRWAWFLSITASLIGIIGLIV